MTTKRKPYNTYTKEFKLEALRLMENSGRKPSDIAMEQGIRRNQLYKWKEQMIKKGAVVTAQKGRQKKEDQSELASIKQELKRVKEENEILKKAVVYPRDQCNTYNV